MTFELFILGVFLWWFVGFMSLNLAWKNEFGEVSVGELLEFIFVAWMGPIGIVFLFMSYMNKKFGRRWLDKRIW